MPQDKRPRRSGRPRAGAIVDLMKHQEPFVTVAALAAYWCVSPDTVYRDIAKGALPVFRVGSSQSIRIRLEDAQAYGRPDDGAEAAWRPLLLRTPVVLPPAPRDPSSSVPAGERPRQRAAELQPADAPDGHRDFGRG